MLLVFLFVIIRVKYKFSCGKLHRWWLGTFCVNKLLHPLAMLIMLSFINFTFHCSLIWHWQGIARHCPCFIETCSMKRNGFGAMNIIWSIYHFCFLSMLIILGFFLMLSDWMNIFIADNIQEHCIYRRFSCCDSSPTQAYLNKLLLLVG